MVLEIKSISSCCGIVSVDPDCELGKHGDGMPFPFKASVHLIGDEWRSYRLVDPDGLRMDDPCDVDEEPIDTINKDDAPYVDVAMMLMSEKIMEWSKNWRK